MSKASRALSTATLVALPLLATFFPSRPAHADVFDGARKTFQTDIPHFFTQDFPHFFQDDIPCAFGGRPTSGTKKSCASSSPGDGKSTAPAAPPPKDDPGENSSSGQK